MIIQLSEIEKTEKYTRYKVADTDFIEEEFKKYAEENKLTELTTNDKITVLRNMGYTDEEINIILQHV